MSGAAAAELDNRLKIIGAAQQKLREAYNDDLLAEERQIQSQQHEALAAISSYLSMLGGAARKLDQDTRRARLQSLKQDQREISKAMRDLGHIR